MKLTLVGQLPTAYYAPEFADAVETMRAAEAQWFLWPRDYECPLIHKPGAYVHLDLAGELDGRVTWTRRDGRTYARWTPWRAW